MNVPIIRLEVEGMKHTLLTALSEHAARVDSGIQAAVEAYCTPENIQAVIDENVRQALDMALKEEVKSFFSWSKPGRIAVKEAVHKRLNDMYPTDDQD